MAGHFLIPETGQTSIPRLFDFWRNREGHVRKRDNEQKNLSFGRFDLNGNCLDNRYLIKKAEGYHDLIPINKAICKFSLKDSGMGFEF
jgi:hypothetical protein